MGYLAAALAVLVTALLVVAGIRLPAPSGWAARIRASARGWRLAAWLLGPLALALLIPFLVASDSAGAATFRLLLGLSLVVLLGLSGVWAWARLRIPS